MTTRHDVTIDGSDRGSAVSCSCRTFKVAAHMVGRHEAQRLAHLHLVHPEAALAELLGFIVPRTPVRDDMGAVAALSSIAGSRPAGGVSQ